MIKKHLYILTGALWIFMTLIRTIGGVVTGFKNPLSGYCGRSTPQMFSTVRRQRRPLGHYVPESRVELQIEKALFRNNAQVLRDMCDKKTRQKQQETRFLNINNFNPIMYEKTRREHIEATNRSQNVPSNISPEVRWLLTRSARLQRANNAGFSKFRNPIKDRVVSASGHRGLYQSLERQRSMCNRIRSGDISEKRRLQCDILGPALCSDCTRIQEKTDVLNEQNKNFPRLEVHTRSLVAPEKVEKLYLSHPKELFNQSHHYPCGCKVNPELEITTPLVYTPHEVFERIRRRKNIEKGHELIKREQAFRREHNNTPEHRPENRIEARPENTPIFYEEKTEAPMDMKVSVTFRAEY